MKAGLDKAVAEITQLMPRLLELHTPLQRLGEAMIECWQRRNKILFAGNGGSAADAMHFAEELVVRFEKNRKALAAIALCDPTVLTCAANDLGYERVFARQIEALGNAGDIFVAISTSGNSANILRAIDAAKPLGLTTVAFTGKDGGALHNRCDIELLIPSPVTARVQEAHKILFHVLCEWIEARTQ